ncbi:hypothetical protein GCM10023216_12990 [Isoptericola chiayiensis]|uniref:Helix-turn-helix domain-containing protein n=2 Tax=Isoptericola chiayiensis TaxID=579446 RepID=A0ABP8Y900_9MICO
MQEPGRWLCLARHITLLTEDFVKTKLSVMGGLLTVSDAAGRLSVSVRQVQHLVARGELRKIARGLVDETSVDRYMAVRSGAHTRAWSSGTAWAAVSLLSGRGSGWIGASQRSRLRQQLRRNSPEVLVVRTRDRAAVTRYRAHPSVARHLSDAVVHHQEAEQRLGLTASTALDGYVAEADLGGLVSQYGLDRDDDGDVVLRATTMDLGVVRELAEGDVVLAALDLAESLDVRERRAGQQALGRALERFRG